MQAKLFANTNTQHNTIRDTSKRDDSADSSEIRDEHSEYDRQRPVEDALLSQSFATAP